MTGDPPWPYWLVGPPVVGYCAPLTFGNHDQRRPFFESQPPKLSDEDIERIARRVVELMTASQPVQE